jgi:adenylylsulfate kinase
MSTNKHIIWHQHEITKADRASLNHQKPVVLWFTGLSGSGKSTIAGAVEQSLFKRGCRCYLLDGDNVRHGLNRDLGFSNIERIENIRRIGEVSKLMVDAGLIVLAAFISPLFSDREMVRHLFEDGEFIEIAMDTPLEICEKRDPKGLYKKARSGEIANFTGISARYEAPESAELAIKTHEMSVNDAVAVILDYLESRNVMQPAEFKNEA